MNAQVQIPMMSPRSEELAKAVRDGRRELALQLIKDGANPFDQGCNASDKLTPNASVTFTTYSPNGFDVAAEKKDINLLLHMVAKQDPLCIWENRFLVCRHGTTLAPVSSRSLNGFPPSPTLSLMTPNRQPEVALLRFKGATKEAVETLLMFGYKFSAADYEQILNRDIYHDDDNGQEWKPLLAMVLAAKIPNIPQSILNKLMSRAIGDSGFTPSRGHRDPLTAEWVFPPFSNFDLALALLKSGADPNALWADRYMNRDVPQKTYLLKALENGDMPMVKLLVKYGADTKAEPVQELAAQVGMEALLVVDSVAVPDPLAYGKQLRKQFMFSFYEEVKNRSAILTVAMMRKTGCVPQKHLMTNLILKYCPLGFSLWEVGMVKPEQTTF